MLEDHIIRDDYFVLSKTEKESRLLEQCLRVLRYKYRYCSADKIFIDNQYPAILANCTKVKFHCFCDDELICDDETICVEGVHNDKNAYNDKNRKTELSVQPLYILG